MDVISRAGTAYHSGAPRFTPGFLWVLLLDLQLYMYVLQIVVCPFIHFFFWPLCCLFFFDIQIMITPLVSSIYSLKKQIDRKYPFVIIQNRLVCFMVLNVTFNNISVISWWSVFYFWWRKLEHTEKTTDLRQITDNNVIHLAMNEIRINNISGDRH